MFQVKPPVFLRTLSLFNARLNHRRSPQTCLRMFRLHDRRPREENAMFRLVMSESEEVRGDRFVFPLQDRASP